MGGEIKAGLNFGLWYKSSIWKNIPQGFQSNKSIWNSLSMVSCSSTIGISYSNRIFLSLMSNATFPSLNQRFHWSRNALWSGEIKFREFDGKHISSIRRSKWNKIMSPFLLQILTSSINSTALVDVMLKILSYAFYYIWQVYIYD